MAITDSTVTVVINIGPRRETLLTSLAARDVDFRPWTGQPSVAGDGQSSAKTGSADAQRLQSRQGETRHQMGGSDRGKGSKIKKSGKPKKGK